MHVTHVERYDDWLSLTLHVGPSYPVELYFFVCDCPQLRSANQGGQTCAAAPLSIMICDVLCPFIVDTCCVSCSFLLSSFSSFIVATIMPMPETIWIVCGGFIAAITADDAGAEGSGTCVLSLWWLTTLCVVIGVPVWVVVVML